MGMSCMNELLWDEFAGVMKINHKETAIPPTFSYSWNPAKRVGACIGVAVYPIGNGSTTKALKNKLLLLGLDEADDEDVLLIATLRYFLKRKSLMKAISIYNINICIYIHMNQSSISTPVIKLYISLRSLPTNHLLGAPRPS